MSKNVFRYVTPFWRQSFVSTGVFLSWISLGCSMGYSSLLLPELRKDPTIKITREAESWIAAVGGIAMFPGTLLVMLIMAKFGRKTTNIITMIPQIISWALIVFAKNVETIIIARVLIGMAVGLSATISSVSMAEYVSPKNRAFLAVISLSVGNALGILLVQALQAFLSWKMTALVCLSFPIVGLVVFICSPDSPYYLASKGRYDECRQTYYWLRGDTKTKHNDELNAMIDAAIASRDNKDVNKKSGTFCAKITRSDFLKPVFVVATLFFMHQINGYAVVNGYSYDIAKTLFEDKLNLNLVITVINAVRIISLIASCIFMKRAKRRFVLYFSGSLTLASMIGLGLCASYKPHHYITFALFISYTFFVMLGVVPLPMNLSGELFPMDVKNIGNCISRNVMNFFYFLTLKTAPYMMDNLGFQGLFYTYAAGLAYCLFVLYFTLPETKDKTLQDIENDYKVNNNNENHEIPSEKECLK